MSTAYEAVRVLARPLLPVLETLVARDLSRLASERDRPFRLLDVGGRSSPYTCGLAAQITILDLPRETDVQVDLQLGIDQRILARLERRRSNIKSVVIDDLLNNTLDASSFDGISAVEVIEHVEEDSRFIEASRRLLGSGGFIYLTTPNGDYIKNEPPNYNPDHIRHYSREGLRHLLLPFFDEVSVHYAVSTGVHRYRGLRSFETSRPVRTLTAMASNLINHFESRHLQDRAQRTAHLVAIGRC